VDEIQIWTDVDGMLSCDPRIVSGAHCLRSISYAEAEQMATAGAKVLHPATVAPAVKQRIPIVIRNSRNSSAPGTRIDRAHPRDGEILSIARRTGLALLRFTPRNTPVTADFGDVVWSAFRQAGVPFDLVGTTRTELSLLVDEAQLTPEFERRLLELSHLTVQRHRAMLSLVGHNAARNPANLIRAVQRLRTLPEGAIPCCCSDSRLAFVVAESCLYAAAETLHQEFFAQPDPALFVVNRSNQISDTQLWPARAMQPAECCS
jgi:aspartate kinase